MITFIKGMLVGMGLAVVIAIAVDRYVSKKENKPKREMFVDGIIEDPAMEMTPKEKFDRIAEEVLDMAHIDDIIQFCKESDFFDDV